MRLLKKLVNNDEIAKTFNKHFETVEKLKPVEKLNTFEWHSNNEDVTKETIKVLSKLKIRT